MCMIPLRSRMLTHDFAVGALIPMFFAIFLSEIKNTIETNRSTYEKGISSYGINSEAYRAMQTCQAWDTIYDPVLKSPITTVSRIWNKQWGGYVLFCWDTYFGALMQSLDNKILAYSKNCAYEKSDKGDYSQNDHH